jgi:hypothetical protein
MNSTQEKLRRRARSLPGVNAVGALLRPAPAKPENTAKPDAATSDTVATDQPPSDQPPSEQPPAKRKRRPFPGSATFWEQRYATGGISGRGSRGPLAEYKANFLNEFIADNNVTSITELGCGDGVQIGMGKYPEYVGMDVSPTAVRTCVSQFADDPTKTFLVYNSGAFADPLNRLQSDASMSLDVLFHLIEDEVWEAYLRDLFSLARRFVIIYASDDRPDSRNRAIIRRPFTKWVEDNISGWKLHERVENPYRGTDDPATKTYSDFFIYVPSDAP